MNKRQYKKLQTEYNKQTQEIDNLLTNEVTKLNIERATQELKYFENNFIEKVKQESAISEGDRAHRTYISFDFGFSALKYFKYYRKGDGYNIDRIKSEGFKETFLKDILIRIEIIDELKSKMESRNVAPTYEELKINKNYKRVMTYLNQYIDKSREIYKGDYKDAMKKEALQEIEEFNRPWTIEEWEESFDKAAEYSFIPYYSTGAIVRSDSTNFYKLSHPERKTPSDLMRAIGKDITVDPRFTFKWKIRNHNKRYLADEPQYFVQCCKLEVYFNGNKVTKLNAKTFSAGGKNIRYSHFYN